MKIWILVSVCDRDIIVEKFNTYEDAYKTMKHDLDQALEFDSESESDQEINGIYAEEDFYIRDLYAWANLRHDYDWTIEELEV